MMAADSDDADHLFAVADYGNMYESFDAGTSWVSRSPIRGTLLRAAGANPRDFRHLIVNDFRYLWHTRDGGPEPGRRQRRRST